MAPLFRSRRPSIRHSFYRFIRRLFAGCTMAAALVLLSGVADAGDSHRMGSFFDKFTPSGGWHPYGPLHGVPCCATSCRTTPNYCPKPLPPACQCSCKPMDIVPSPDIAAEPSRTIDPPAGALLLMDSDPNAAPVSPR